MTSVDAKTAPKAGAVAFWIATALFCLQMSLRHSRSELETGIIFRKRKEGGVDAVLIRTAPKRQGEQAAYYLGPIAFEVQYVVRVGNGYLRPFPPFCKLFAVWRRVVPAQFLQCKLRRFKFPPHAQHFIL